MFKRYLNYLLKEFQLNQKIKILSKNQNNKVLVPSRGSLYIIFVIEADKL